MEKKKRLAQHYTIIEAFIVSYQLQGSISLEQNFDHPWKLKKKNTFIKSLVVLSFKQLHYFLTTVIYLKTYFGQILTCSVKLVFFLII